MKFLGASFFILATSLIGFDLSNRLTLRTEQIRMLIFSLQMIEAEMTYSQLSLRQIFLNVQQKTKKPIATFYERLAKLLDGVVTDFTLIWNDELLLLQQRSMLKNEEIDILKQFGQNIGNHTIEQQKKQIKLTIYYLQKQLDESIEEKNKYDKTVKSLGFLFGVLIVLILI